MNFSIAVGVFSAVVGLLVSVAPGGSPWLAILLAGVLYLMFTEELDPVPEGTPAAKAMKVVRVGCIIWASVLASQMVFFGWLEERAPSEISETVLSIRDAKQRDRLWDVPAKEIKTPLELSDVNSYVVHGTTRQMSYAAPTTDVVRYMGVNWSQRIEMWLGIFGIFFLFLVILAWMIKPATDPLKP